MAAKDENIYYLALYGEWLTIPVYSVDFIFCNYLFGSNAFCIYIYFFTSCPPTPSIKVNINKNLQLSLSSSLTIYLIAL